MQPGSHIGLLGRGEDNTYQFLGTRVVEDREREGGRERNRGESSKCARVLLVAAAEDITCQDPKGRPVQMPEY